MTASRQTRSKSSSVRAASSRSPAESSLCLVGPGQLAGQELGPEFLQDLVGKMLVANFQMNVAGQGIVIPAHELFHGSLTFRAWGMGARDRGPARGDFGQAVFCHRCHPGANGPSTGPRGHSHGETRTGPKLAHRFT
jgi:hypothetical protein